MSCAIMAVLLQIPQRAGEMNIYALLANVVSVILSQKNVEFVTPYYKLHLIQADQDDNKFVDCAFTAGASCIVSNDAHFKILKEVKFPRIYVVNIKDFVELLLRNQGNDDLNQWTYSHWNELNIHCHVGTIGAVFDFFVWRRYIIGNTLFLWNMVKEAQGAKIILQQSLRPLRFPFQGTETFFTIKEGSTSHLGLLPSGKKRKTALRCSEPLRYKVGGPIKGLARFCGLEPPGNSSLQFTVFCSNLLMSCRFLSIFLVVSKKKRNFALEYERLI